MACAPVPFAAIRELADIHTATIQYPAILKTARLGYDGKGQITVHSAQEAQDAFCN